MPKTAIMALDHNNLLKTHASAKTHFALNLPRQQPGGKQFLVYNSTAWRDFPALREGLFSDNLGNASASIPPLEGRFHDFYGPCHNCTESNGAFPGAIMTYYGGLLPDRTLWLALLLPNFPPLRLRR